MAKDKKKKAASEFKDLKKRLSELRAELKVMLEPAAKAAGEAASKAATSAGEMATEVAEAAGKATAKIATKVAAKVAPSVSPLAPKTGFPALPVIGGVRFAAVEAGVRYANRTDVMLVEVAAGSAMAGVFTRSSTRSACVLDCEAKLAKLGKSATKSGYAIIVNSGNSNAFTGTPGLKAMQAVTGGVAKAMNIPEGHVFSSSTGVIGEVLKAERITAKLPDLAKALSPEGIDMAARAIMTTDTFPKGSVAKVKIGTKTVKIAGIAKGSGMVAPDMATMLVYIFTDAKISQPLLQKMVSGLTDTTFNAITVDGDTSTSDSLLMAATGAAGNTAITAAVSVAGKAFQAALGKVMLDLAHQVVKDGEGATKFVEVAVSGAATGEDARKVAMSIANSPLVKTAIAGQDPNWGRVVMAVGKSGAAADRDKLRIRFGDVLVAEKGFVSPKYSEAAAAAYMKGENLVISVDMGLGKGAYTAWTCDLTHRYIDINADYRS